MATYTQYKNTRGTFWRVRGIVGIDEYTGKKSEIKKGGFVTKREAKAYFEKQREEFVSGLARGTQSLTFEAVYQEWLKGYENTVRESTLVTTQNAFYHHVIPAFGHLRIDKIKPDLIQEYVNQWCNQYKKGKTFYYYAKRVFKFAVRCGYIKKSPCDRVIVPRKTEFEDKENKKQFYTREELQQFLDGLKDNNMWYTFFRVLAYTGMRRGECLALTWDDINFKVGTISINKTLAQKAQKVVDGKPTGRELIVDKPKNGRSRVVSVDSVTLEILKAWQNEQAQLLIKQGYNALNGKQLLFSSLAGNKFIEITRPRKVALSNCKRQGLPFIKIHGFRHTHASLLFEAGVPMKDVQERLGHSDISMTMDIYTHVSESRQHGTADVFAQYMNG